MNEISNLQIDGKDIKRLYINDKLVYSTSPNYTDILNNSALDILNNAELLGTDSYTLVGDGKTYTYNVYSTFEEGEWTGGTAGNVRPWFLTPHIMVSVNHYGTLNYTGNITINGVTYNRLKWYSLIDWAAERGITVPTLHYADDICLCTLDKSTGLDIEKCPYVLDSNTIKDMFWESFVKGVMCWHSPQKSINKQYAVPCILNMVDSSVKYTLEYGDIKDETLKTKLQEMGKQYGCYSGDSGKAIYLMIDNKPVVIGCVSHVNGTGSVIYPAIFYTVVNVLREFVKWYEGSDILKVFKP